MINEIKNKIEQHIPSFLAHLDKTYLLSSTSPLLFNTICDFVMRKGKRARPILFIIGYHGFTGKKPEALYTSALSLELLHDFMLVHDDIIDKSALRRGKPSVHTLLNKYLKPFKNATFSGEDLSIIIGDVMYALGLQAFLCVEEKHLRKEKAMKKLIDAAIYTGFGEFIEVLSTIKDISKIDKSEIYKIYDFKTACYTFATPLAMGALLAGASDIQAEILFQYGIYLGRAFQIKDDILGIFAEETEIGKSIFSDLKEAKKTILVWYAYRHTQKKNQRVINGLLGKKNLCRRDLLEARDIITDSGALDYAKNEVSHLMTQADALLKNSRIKPRFRQILLTYAKEILQV